MSPETEGLMIRKLVDARRAISQAMTNAKALETCLESLMVAVTDPRTCARIKFDDRLAVAVGATLDDLSDEALAMVRSVDALERALATLTEKSGR